MHHWTDSKIRVHAFYCLLGVSLVSKYSKASLFWGSTDHLSACLGLPRSGIPELWTAAKWVRALQTTYGSVD